MSFLGELRPYQDQARAFLLNRGSALLALDLGTGKTVVSIAAIEELRTQGKVKCALLIMSSSLTAQWVERIHQFTDSESVVLVDGSLTPTKRSNILSNVMEHTPEYLIMGIRQVVQNIDLIIGMAPDLVLVDEVTSIKNFSTQQTKAIKKLKSTYRIGLTAEPIENGKAEEMFSIMEWIDRSVFGNWRDFELNYIKRNSAGIITGYRNVPELNKQFLTACFVKRRDDKDVAEFMPTVEEYNCYVEMDDDIDLVYRRIARDLLDVLYSAGDRASIDLDAHYSGGRQGGSDHQLGPIGSRLGAAQLLLSSPTLLRASGERYNESGDDGGSKYAAGLLDALRGLSVGPKLEACVELAEEYLKANSSHKVIVFSKYKGILPMLEKELKEYNPVLFSGDLNGRQRGEAISRFTNDSDCRLFLSSDAGGYGVDLYAASHLINFNLPDSSGALKQRNGRHVRANSKFRHVYIDNLLVKGSIEEYQQQRLAYKGRVSSAVLTGLSDVRGNLDNDVTSLTKFLKDYLNG
jgi:SNF2 family DNA or RNA helicase